MGYEEALNEARSLMASGDYDAAQRAESVLCACADSTENHREKGLSLQGAAVCAAKAGRLTAALTRFEDAESLLTDDGDLLGLYESWGAIVFQSGRADLAPAIRERTLAVLSSYGDAVTHNLPFALGTLARLELMMGGLNDALATATKAVSVALLMETARAEAYSTLSLVREALGDVAEAMNALDEAKVYMTEGHCLMEAEAQYARLALLQDDVKTATHHLRSAMAFPDLRDRMVLAKVFRVMGMLIDRDPQAAKSITDRFAAFLENPARVKEVIQ